MTYQQQAIEFFSSTEKTGWGKNQIVEKLRELSGEELDPALINSISTERLDLQSDRLSTHDDVLMTMEGRLCELEKYCHLTQKEISSTDDDVPPF